MNEELNELKFNNINVTFTGVTNNTATSDELEASNVYQDKMGTNYSRSKNIARAFNFAGISLILTAAAIKTGSLIANAFVLNPPSVEEVTYSLKEFSFSAKFVVSNPANYQMNYYLLVNDEEVIKEDCSEEKEYLVEYSHLQVNDECRFYIEFTNKVDYKKVIENYSFKMEA